ncbi:urea carboxylase [Alcanivorax sp. 1008]|uniref:urea carboxylase n=1 Tax=Alcanivorax sp. 1008 TaxID=2816853 RepID=UPI001DD90D6D|nr:urea carboxylase [Alcanivorax sp. 1008]MCC1495643.1 urea carboxylase [Alcanivorax sp. 1008]
MFGKVLIANRGAISVRIQRTLKKMGVESVAVYSRADAGSLHVQQASHSICLGEALAADTYLSFDKVIAAAKQTGAEAIHPGYGFLSENLDFAAACEQAGIVFIGPRAEQISAFGLKHTARALAEQSGVPLLPGSGLLTDVEDAVARAAAIGFPVMLKSTAGGGGIGMQRCYDAEQLREVFASVQRLSRNNFSNDGLFLEKFVERARHIEVQIFGDGQGTVVALGERDCSLQRRNQKVVEETPAPNLPDPIRQAMWATAVRLGEAVNYRNAGTVEFIYDDTEGKFYFLEVNTRLQVEHGVTEMVSGVDLVEWMIRLAAGDRSFLDGFAYQSQGHAIQVRLYAEDPGKNFQPSAGLLTEVTFPEDIRVDSWVTAGLEVPAFYDPMLAKLIVHQPDRDEALAAISRAVEYTRLEGIETNLRWLRQVVVCDSFREGTQTTAFLNDFPFTSSAIDVLDGGTMTTVQDWPGRTGYWDVGVPPSGPCDELSLRLGNRLLGNDERAAGLEMTLTGARLHFRSATRVVISGADMQAHCNGEALENWQVHKIPAGAELRFGSVKGAGSRTYLCVAGGIDVPEYLGSRSTFTLGRFGGHGGRALRNGDVLHPGREATAASGSVPMALRPALNSQWTIRVIYGPHGAPDFFTPEDIDTFFDTEWEVHYNSSRTGIRLIGPRPQWARTDGGEAGLHPSNIHDNAYAVGAVDFTGDMPVILGPDGPSLGGFVCPVTIIRADLWMLGQLRAGDRIRFVAVDQASAEALQRQQGQSIASLLEQAPVEVNIGRSDPVLATVSERDGQVAVVYRASGDDNILVEYGPQVLDLNLRFRVHALMEWLQQANITGVLQLTPGIRSLQVHYDNSRLPQQRLLTLLQQGEAALPAIEDMQVPSRIVHLPISWDDEQCRLAIEKYMQSVRSDAPWCPSNLEFIRRINGLDDIEKVKEIFFNASYMVMGLGDVYLGAPVATPVDPRHRLVTTKYNPARTWTPENAVGIGGAYLCVYGMEGPGGYQFVGRTIQMWNTWQQTAEFAKDSPWLLRFFDQLRFYPVSHEELMQWREDFPRGRVSLKIEETRFSLREYNDFLHREADGIAAFKNHQQASFEAERERWAAAGQDLTVIDEAAPDSAETVLDDGEYAVSSSVPGSLWQLTVKPGDQVKEGDVVAVIESMKMEIPLHSTVSGEVLRLLCEPGTSLATGQALLVIREEIL